MIIGILFLLLIVPFILIVEKLFPKKFLQSENNTDKNLFFENEKFKIWEQDIDFETLNKDYFPLYRWLTDVVGKEPTDLFVIRKLFDNENNTEINHCFYTYFSMQNKHFVFLQKLVLENDNIHSFLVSFDKTTGKIDTITEVGNFILFSFDYKNRTISGNNFENNIVITFEK